MSDRNKSLAIPILIITVGIGWLLTVQGVAPQINWIWTLGMASIGVLCFVLLGFDKVSVVVGPLFLVSSMLSVLRQTGLLSIDSEVPILVIIIGVLLLVARLPNVPPPKWLSPVGPKLPDD